MRHASDAAKTDDAIREVLDRLDTTGPRYAALAPYDRLVVASAAAVALSVNIDGVVPMPTAANALLCEARQIIYTDLPPSEAASLNRLQVAVAGVVDRCGNLRRR